MKTKAIPFLILVTVVSVLASLGYSIAGVIRPELILGDDIPANEGTFIFALYSAARTLPLAVMCVVCAVRKDVRSLLTLGILAGCIQFLDSFIGFYQHDLVKSAGPLFTAVVQFAAVYFAFRQSRGAFYE